MTKFLFCGDLHGDLDCAERVADVARENKCDEIIQVGDWGFLWPDWETKWVVKELSDILQNYNVRMRFCDGNHEWHPELRKSKRDTEDNVASFITYQFRGSIKEWPGGPTMVFMGGAPSIDKRGRTPGINWWEEEYITDEDVAETLKHKGKKIDVLVTHDCAVPIPGFKESDDMSFYYRARASQSAVGTVLKGLNPKYNIHGHYHHRYETTTHDTRVIGLGSNINKFPDLYWIYEWSN